MSETYPCPQCGRPIKTVRATVRGEMRSTIVTMDADPVVPAHWDQSARDGHGAMVSSYERHKCEGVRA